MKTKIFTLVLFLFSFYAKAQVGCDCQIDFNMPFICAQDSSGSYHEVPNACFAECFGMTVVSDSLCNNSGGGGWEGCDCEFDPNEPFICVQDSIGTYFEVPNACFAECWGYVVVADSLCTIGGPWTECDCEINPNEPYVCVQDSTGAIFSMPNACFAACYGLTVVADTLCEINEGWVACNCEITEGEPFICAVDSIGHPCYVPNACYAECLGLSIVSDTICEMSDLNIFEDDFIECLGDLQSYTYFQDFLLALNTNCDFEIPACILSAPIFNNDSLFFEYIMSNCGSNITSGGNVMNVFNSFNSANGGISGIKNDNKDDLGLSIIQNPVSNDVNLQISTKKEGNVVINIYNLNGQSLLAFNKSLSKGLNQISIDVSNLNSGLYILSIYDKNEVKTLKFVKE
jgi:hypothetical protein